MDIWINNHLVDEHNKMNKSHHVKPGRKLPLYNLLSVSLKINSHFYLHMMWGWTRKRILFTLHLKDKWRAQSKEMKASRKPNQTKQKPDTSYMLTNWNNVLLIGCPLREEVAKQPLEEGHLNVFQVAFILSEPIMLNGDTYLQAANTQLIRNHIWIISECLGSPEAAKSISAHMSLSINCICYLSCHLPIIRD